MKELVRVGGQSQSSQLEEVNLRTVSRIFPLWNDEKVLLRESYAELDDLTTTASTALNLLCNLRRADACAALTTFLASRFPRIWEQFDGSSREMTQETVEGKSVSDWLCLMNDHTGSKPHEGRYDTLLQRAENDVACLSTDERCLLVEIWTRQIEREETERLVDKLNLANGVRNTIAKVHAERDRRALLCADVVGVTTSGLAKNAQLFQKLGSKVMLCEEAAEVLEAHLISALMPGLEHLIQIGDHQQLRPLIKTHNLSVESRIGQAYQLDRSQFERLAAGAAGATYIPVARLQVQRRMRPEISRLVRLIYRGLEDHPGTMHFTNVVGMRHNVFWLNHEYTEDASGKDHSRSNQWEVEMTRALVLHLIRQSVYSGNDLAVLTPYAEQLQKLRTALSKDFELCLNDRDQASLAHHNREGGAERRKQKVKLIHALRLATIDNFQGEEAKVVILSLVRSNRQRDVGFLKTENRINVAISRAQQGMFVIGNMRTYSRVPMWTNILRELETTEAIGPAFDLRCPRHPSASIVCAEPEDFQTYSPEGGCLLDCDKPLQGCDHRCTSKCHSDTMHAVESCQQPCTRIKSPCGHRCTQLCGDPCGPCVNLLDDIELPCGHFLRHLPCHQIENQVEMTCRMCSSG